jgi:hypothetical protein
VLTDFEAFSSQKLFRVAIQVEGKIVASGGLNGTEEIGVVRYLSE